MTARLALAAAFAVAPAAAYAEFELSFYLGAQEAAHSRVYIDDPVIGTEDFLTTWEGRSFEAPPYYGIRGTWWRSDTFGFGVDFAHSKVYASDGTLRDNGYDVLEFTDGVNILTVNAYRRWNDLLGNFTPYVGGGLGISIPHVEVTKGASETFEYQFGGPAMTLIAGVSYDINDDWAVFGEYKNTYSPISVDLDTGGELETDLVTNAVNFGVTYKF